MLGSSPATPKGEAMSNQPSPRPPANSWNPFRRKKKTYEQGYSDGYNAGQTDGYNEGHRHGYDEGWQKALEAVQDKLK